MTRFSPTTCTTPPGSRLTAAPACSSRPPPGRPQSPTPFHYHCLQSVCLVSVVAYCGYVALIDQVIKSYCSFEMFLVFGFSLYLFGLFLSFTNPSHYMYVFLYLTLGVSNEAVNRFVLLDRNCGL